MSCAIRSILRHFQIEVIPVFVVTIKTKVISVLSIEGCRISLRSCIQEIHQESPITRRPSSRGLPPSSFTMHSRHLIALLLLLASAVHSQAGISKETFFTLGFSICSEELSSSGTCCPQGEACLDTGLCFGGAGLLNRRACVDIWESSPYLTFCENSKFLQRSLGSTKLMSS